MARVFNGSSDLMRADAGRVFNKATEASASAWVFYASPATARDVYAEASTVNTNNLFGFGTDPSTPSTLNLSVKINVSSPNTVNVSGTTTVFENAWHHILLTQDTSNNLLVYIDGSVDISTSYSSAATYSSNDLCFGALARSANAAFFGGRIAEVANWTRTLTATEAMQLALGVPASQLVPDHYWPLAGVASPEPDIGNASTANASLAGTTSAAGPPIVGLATFNPSLGRRPVPMIKGPDKDKVLSMRGNSF